MMKIILRTALTLLLSASFNQAYALDLGIPLDCMYGEDCFIENYFDHNKEIGKISDRACGKITKDGHTSTDFKLRNYKQMHGGVNVIAGDSGVIAGIRDGMSDVSVDLIGESAVRGRECGNGVVIKHKRGYQTQYCHLKKSSITVKKGDKIEKGEYIGQVGLSGLTTFPYLEFTVRLEDKIVDPFTGDDPLTGNPYVACDSLDIYPLWDKKTEKKFRYIETALLSSGFSEKVPHSQGAREGKFNKKNIRNTSKLIVIWVDIFGAIKDDELRITLVSPDKKIIGKDVRQFSNSKRHAFQFFGKKADGKIWPKGEYTGKIELLRKVKGEVERIISHSIITEVIDPNVKTE